MNAKQENTKKNTAKKINFSQKKENTVNSLFEVEHFLCNVKHALKYINLYKFLK